MKNLFIITSLNNFLVGFQNHGKGCEWKGLTRLMKIHVEDECLYEYENVRCLFCNETLHIRDIDQHELDHLKILCHHPY